MLEESAMTMRGAHESQRPSRLTMARSRGAVSGPLLMLLGAWGAIIPFIGHYWGYGFTPDNTWTWTTARGWMEVAPGAATFVGGLMLTGASNRVSAMLGGWLAALAGAWFALGLIFSPLWSAGYIGHPSATTTTDAVWERIGMFDGLGVVIVFLAALGLGRVSVVAWRDVEASRREIVLDDAGAGYAGTTPAAPAYPAEPTTTVPTTATGTAATTTGPMGDVSAGRPQTTTTTTTRRTR